MTDEAHSQCEPPSDYHGSMGSPPVENEKKVEPYWLAVQRLGTGYGVFRLPIQTLLECRTLMRCADPYLYNERMRSAAFSVIHNAHESFLQAQRFGDIPLQRMLGSASERDEYLAKLLQPYQRKTPVELKKMPCKAIFDLARTSLPEVSGERERNLLAYIFYALTFRKDDLVFGRPLEPLGGQEPWASPQEASENVATYYQDLRKKYPRIILWNLPGFSCRGVAHLDYITAS